MAKKAQKILDYIYRVMDAIDKTGKNTEVYKEYFENLSEEELKKELKQYLTDPKDHFTVELDPFDQNITLEQIADAGKIANVLLEDYLVMPHISNDPNNPYVTNEKVMIACINQRRVQQTLSVKNHVSTSINKRNPKTGQVIDDDKNARISDMEMYQLIYQGALNSLAEYFGPRSDDMEMKNEMLFQIQRKGSVSLDELPSLAKNKTALNYLNFILLSAGYETDLINDKGLLPITIERGGKIYND